MADKLTNALKDKIYDGARISPEEGLALFDWDLLELGAAADFRRRLAVPGNEVGFIIDRIINYTNVCEARCAFCAFHADAGRVKAFELSTDEILDKTRELAEAGGTQVMLQGGLHPGWTLERLEELFTAIKQDFPGIYLHSLSPAEITYIAHQQNLSIHEVIGRLQAAGLDSSPGASDLLVDHIRRQVCANKVTTDEWCDVIRALRDHDMVSTATMTYGLGETLADRITHLDTVRNIQDETGNLMAFIPWSFAPARTRMSHIRPASGLDYLKILAISRIYLDNITHFQAGWLTEGLKLGQIALTFGADDMGGVLTEEIVVSCTGAGRDTTRDEMIDLITDAGRIPVQRDSRYHPLRRFA